MDHATTLTRPNVRQAVPFFGVSDMQASLDFYVGGLGFTKANAWVHLGRTRWCALKHGGAEVMLQEFWRPGDDHPASKPAGALGQGVCVCFICADAPALYRDFVARGVAAKRPFVGNGMWVVEVRDPDGYALVFESATNVAEDTQFDPALHGAP